MHISIHASLHFIFIGSRFYFMYMYLFLVHACLDQVLCTRVYKKFFKTVYQERLVFMHALVTGSATVNLSWAYSGFNSTSLLFGTGCVNGSGSLSGGAFNQLKLVTLSVI